METNVAQMPPNQSTVAAVAGPRASALPVNLTTDEKKWRYEFIGKLTDRNKTFPSNNKFGVMKALTVQDLCNSTTKTLQDIAVSLKKAEGDHDPEFNGNDALKINGITAQDWLQFLRLTIRKKNWDVHVADKRETIKDLEKQIAEAKTPEEKRREAELMLQGLKSGTGLMEEED